MKLIDMVESGVIPTSKFGKLKIVSVVLTYDYPRCFIASSKDNTYYAFLENKDYDDCFGWNVSIVSLDEINDVNMGNKNIQSLFLNETSKYIVEFKNNENVGQVIDVIDFEGEYAIRGNLYVNDFCDMEEVFDYHKLHMNSKIENKASLSLLYENTSGSNTGLVFKTIRYINELAKKLKHPLDIMNSNFSVKAGSTVITFEFDPCVECNLFGENKKNDYDTPIIELGRVLNAMEPEQIISETDGIKAIDKYSKMLDTFSHQIKQRPKIVFAIPQKDKAISFNFGEKNCQVKKQIVKIAKEFYESNKKISDEILIINGVLTGILTGKNSKFTFLSDEQKVYTGSVDFKMLDNLTSFVVKGCIYKATIKKTTIMKNNEVTKEGYVLLDLESIGRNEMYEQIKLFDDFN